MGPVAERAKLRASAATERNGAASRVDLATPLVAESKGASDHQWSVLVGDDLGRLLTHDDSLPAGGGSYAPPPFSVRSADSAISASRPPVARCRRGCGESSRRRARSSARVSAPVWACSAIWSSNWSI